MLSRNWRVNISHRGTFTGLCFTLFCYQLFISLFIITILSCLLSQIIGGALCLSACQQWLACWNAEDVTLLDIETGQVSLNIQSGAYVIFQVKKTFDGGEEDGFSCFALHPSDKELLTASARSFLLSRWEVYFKSER